jgi:hypothetical protein
MTRHWEKRKASNSPHVNNYYILDVAAGTTAKAMAATFSEPFS